MIFSILAIACFVVMTVLLVLSLVRFPSKVFNIDLNKNKKQLPSSRYCEGVFCAELFKILLIPFIALVLIGVCAFVDDIPNSMEYIPGWLGGIFGFGLVFGGLALVVFIIIIRFKSGIPTHTYRGKVRTRGQRFGIIVNREQLGAAVCISTFYFISFLIFGMTLVGLLS